MNFREGMMRLASLMAMVVVCVATGALAEPGYYRYPTLAGDKIIFTAEGDLWSVPSSGGRATRLTTHAGQETRAAASPDGKMIAFNASYDGSSEVYVIATEGGLAKRVTYEGGAAAALGWTPLGEVLYATQNNIGPTPERVVAAVTPDGAKRRVLPLADAGDAAIAGDGTIIFGRFGLSLSNDNARFYRGGLTARLWRYDPKGVGDAEPFKTEKPANDRRPMLAGERIYFISDADGRDNLW